jgi:hypothetical protein
MSENKYYIVSLKHTSKGDTALTFFGPNNCGYAWHRKNVGVYGEEVHKYTDVDAVAVDKEQMDKFWMNALDFTDEYVSVPNNRTILQLFGLSEKYMKAKKFAGCRMVFLNTPVCQ